MTTDDNSSAPLSSPAVRGAKEAENPPSLVRTVRNWLRSTLRSHYNASLEESVAELIEEHNDGTLISSEERVMLHNILSFGELKVDDIMVPRTDIVAIDLAISLDELKKVVLEKEHTRMPVYEGSLDTVIGFLHIKDLLSAIINDQPFNLKKLVRQVLFVPPSMKLIDLLARMKEARVHMALVLDEYGGTDGLVTVEDLVEEIVGEIEDEHDDMQEPDIIPLPDGVMEANARVTIENLEKALGTKIIEGDKEEGFDTLGGLLFSLVGHVPVQGEIITHGSGIVFEVIDADPRRIKRLLIRRPEVQVESE